ncbi:MAG: hypothetical protein AAFS10_15790, partial [Myxococcota bacterium]
MHMETPSPAQGLSKGYSLLHRGALRAALGLLCVLATGCGLCERVEEDRDAAKSAASFATLIPADADLAVFAGDLKAVRDGLASADRSLGAQFPIKAALAEVERAIGVDPTNAEAMRSKGVQSERGLAVVRTDEQATLLMAVENQELFSKHLNNTAQQRWGGAAKPIDKKIGDHQIQLLVKKSAIDPQQQKPPMLTASNVIFAWTFVGKVAVVTPGKELVGNTKDPEIILGQVLATTEATSLSKQPDYVTLTKTIGSAYPIYAIYNFPGALERQAKRTPGEEEAKALRETAGRFARLGLGLKVTDERAQLRALMLMQPDTLKQFTQTTQAMGDFKLHGALSDKNPLLLKVAVNPTLVLDQFAQTLNADERA